MHRETVRNVIHAKPLNMETQRSSQTVRFNSVLLSPFLAPFPPLRFIIRLLYSVSDLLLYVFNGFIWTVVFPDMYECYNVFGFYRSSLTVIIKDSLFS